MWTSWRCYRQSSALALGRSLSHLLPAHQNIHQINCKNLSQHSTLSCVYLYVLCVHVPIFVLVYLIVSQCVESFPVVVNLSCDIFILQNDSGHPTLTPFFRKRQQKFKSNNKNINTLCVCMCHLI